ncbi:MAG: helix-turn-helix transcriptional regulator [Clostridia bacterium]|nr:helix-turn-helix transcriptional regulator [Clostridia bacterium]
MKGILLSKPILYKHASLRYFEPHEHHITRYSMDDVLLLVFEGVLRFSENGTPYEIHAGEYFIQEHDTFQEGEQESDAPAYLYVHFQGEWADEGNILAGRGSFSCEELSPCFDRLDSLFHAEASYIEQCAVFYEILSLLCRKHSTLTLAEEIAACIEENCSSDLTLAALSERFHFSKNHIINLFRQTYGMTPFFYLNLVRIKKAQRLLEVTSRTAESIAFECGFCDYSHFYKTFRQVSGTTPNAWRQNCRMQALK